MKNLILMVAFMVVGVLGMTAQADAKVRDWNWPWHKPSPVVVAPAPTPAPVPPIVVEVPGQASVTCNCSNGVCGVPLVGNALESACKLPRKALKGVKEKIEKGCERRCARRASRKGCSCGE